MSKVSKSIPAILPFYSSIVTIIPPVGILGKRAFCPRSAIVCFI
jgi:hypothetical protein